MTMDCMECNKPVKKEDRCMAHRHYMHKDCCKKHSQAINSEIIGLLESR